MNLWTGGLAYTGVPAKSQVSTCVYDEAHEIVRVGGDLRKQQYLVKNSTEAVNKVSYRMELGDVMLTTMMEHHSMTGGPGPNRYTQPWTKRVP